VHHASGIWSLVHAGRAALAADLADLTGQRRAALSLCAGFTVRPVLAPLTAGASLNPVRWLAGVIRCRSGFGKRVARRRAGQLGATPAETLARFRCVVTSTIKPPLPAAAMPGETIVHAGDIRRPPGIHRDCPITALTGWPATTRALTSSSSPRGGSPAGDCKPATAPSPPAPGRWRPAAPGP
jgi:uncharacterized protein (TIGR03083 family)